MKEVQLHFTDEVRHRKFKQLTYMAHRAIGTQGCENKGPGSWGLRS